MLIAAADAVVHEATLFAAICFLVGGVDDLLVDLVYGVRRIRELRCGARTPRLDDFPAGRTRGRIAVFVAAWDESAVIGAMLRAALERFDHPDYRIYVGTYPNDPATTDIVEALAEQDARIRLVVGPRPGPTTKADCLNTLWRALLGDEQREGLRVKGIALHDAEDLVHRGELRVFDHYLERFAAVQLPVLPLVHPHSRLVSGHYCDEFAEAHGRQLPAREAIGAGLPFAGVGCALSREMLGAIAAPRGGAPFDASSLTEDYELGLTVADFGGRTAFASVRDGAGGGLVAVRAYFPDRFGAAVKQKARWMTGIALAGWDRVGWSAGGRLGEHWMRMRDRRATLAMPVLALAYGVLPLWGVSWLSHWAAGHGAVPIDPTLGAMFKINFALLGWRLATRALCVARFYGPRQAALSVPRLLLANFIGLAAAGRALTLYLRMLRGGGLYWEKTAHQFPEALP